jgi:HK97 family phage major capsid protein
MKGLLERRASIVTALRKLNEEPAGDGGDLSSEQQEIFERSKKELESVDAQIERQQFLDDLERRADATPILHGTGDHKLDMKLRQFSFLRAVGHAAGMDVDAGMEREISQELQRRSGRPAQGFYVPMEVFQRPIEKRVVTTGLPAAGPGSNLVATDHYGNQFIDIIRANTVVRALGARILTDLVGNIDVPMLKGSATSGWVAENAALTLSDAQFGKVPLSPKHVGAIMELSRNMLMQSSPDVEMIVRDDMGQKLGETVDKAALIGGGTNEPTGILSDTNVTAQDAWVPTSAWETILQLLELVQSDRDENVAFVTNPSVERYLRAKERHVTDETNVVSQMVMERPNELAGYPLRKTTLLPKTFGTGSDASPLICGVWSDLILGYWSVLDVLVNPYESTAYSKGNVQIRAMLTMDLAIPHPESFAHNSHIVTG